MATILVVDDQDRYLQLVSGALPEHDYLGPARDWSDTQRLLAEASDTALVLLDVNLELPEERLLGFRPGLDARAINRLRRRQGLEILAALRESWPELPVILMTSLDGLHLERDAERLEAQDYTYFLEDDYIDLRSLTGQIERILAVSSAPASDGPVFWGQSLAMRRLEQRLKVLARGRLPVVLLGPTGTGKSLMARHVVHPRSRRQGSFVAVDLSTVPRELMAAQLFGSARGSYTGSVADRKGAFEEAHGGTLFLDEVGNLPLDAQKMLLTVLQEGVVSRIGETRERQVDVKLVVATNEDLAHRVREGSFRADLFMRLNPATAVTLPPLTERQLDWTELLTFTVNRALSQPYLKELVEEYREAHGLEAGRVRVTTAERPAERARTLWLAFPERSMELLGRHPWPGNLREFAMTVENAALFALAEQVGVPGERVDVVQIQPKLVRELLRATAVLPDQAADAGPDALTIRLEPQSTLNKVSQACERQYFTWLYLREEGDFAAMAEVLLGAAEHARKVQLRFNQLGLKVRDFKDQA